MERIIDKWIELRACFRTEIHPDVHYQSLLECSVHSELGTLEWWISRLMLNPLFLLISPRETNIISRLC